MHKTTICHKYDKEQWKDKRRATTMTASQKRTSSGGNHRATRTIPKHHGTGSTNDMKAMGKGSRSAG
jgi:hypothetical protein